MTKDGRANRRMKSPDRSAGSSGTGAMRRAYTRDASKSCGSDTWCTRKVYASAADFILPHSADGTTIARWSPRCVSSRCQRARVDDVGRRGGRAAARGGGPRRDRRRVRLLHAAPPRRGRGDGRAALARAGPAVHRRLLGRGRDRRRPRDRAAARGCRVLAGRMPGVRIHPFHIDDRRLERSSWTTPTRSSSASATARRRAR